MEKFPFGKKKNTNTMMILNQKKLFLNQKKLFLNQKKLFGVIMGTAC
jgi:hypothetical protein